MLMNSVKKVFSLVILIFSLLVVHIGPALAQEYELASEEEVRRVEEEWNWAISPGKDDTRSRPLFYERKYKPDTSITIECIEGNPKGCYHLAKFSEAFFNKNDAIKNYRQACEQGIELACQDIKRLSNVDLASKQESFDYLFEYQDKREEAFSKRLFSIDPADPYLIEATYNKFLTRAKRGDPYAAKIIGDVYGKTATQRSLGRDYVTTGIKEKKLNKLILKAAKYYDMACRQRVADACTRLGGLYHNGSFGHEVDYRTSVRLFRKACHIRSPIACESVRFEKQKADIIHEKMVKFYHEGDYASGLRAAGDLLKIRKALYGDEDALVAQTIFYISEFYRGNGQPYLAEEKSLEAYEIWKSYGFEENFAISQAFDSMSLIEFDRERYHEAEELLERSVRIKERFIDADPIFLAGALGNLGVIYAANGELTRAEGNFRRALKMLNRESRVHLLEISKTQGNLAFIQRKIGKPVIARNLYHKSIKMIKDEFDEYHPTLIHLHMALAELDHKEALFSKAENNLLSALEIANFNFPKSHPEVINAHINLADFYLYKKDPKLAKAHNHFSQAAKEIDKRLILQNNGSAWLRRSVEIERKLYSEVYSKYATTSALLSLRSEVPDEFLFIESFDATQRSLNSTAGRAIGQSTARLMSDNKKDGKKLRDRQDGEMEWHRILNEYKQSIAFSDGVSEVKNGTTYLDLLEEVEAKILDLDSQLKLDFPTHYAFTSPEPLSVPEIQELLGDDEALILILAGNLGTLVFAVSKDEVAFSAMSMDIDELAESVRFIRSSLEAPSSRFPMDQAYGLYRSLFDGVEHVFKGKDQIMIVPSGALGSMPMGVLVTEQPTELSPSTKNLRSTKWWGAEQALTVLPSVSSLRSLRGAKLRKPGKKPFAGFGNPFLEKEGSLDADKLASRGTNAYFAGQYADHTALKSLGGLPATKDELLVFAKALGAKSKKSLWLGKRNTETIVKTLDLSDREIIAFATHALMSGEISGYAEPGLVFTPPSEASDFDDGFLTTTEITKLKLNADWVILSACNTASANKLGAEGLSGLARAFFYAGARSVLASHWQVSDKATAKLTTQTILFRKADPSLSKAEALRLSIVSLMGDASNPKYAHPYYWAPFVLIGDGY